ncbi:MAG: lytic transglycosylase domain-containing protein [Usitatibacteraceae bacterium]
MLDELKEAALQGDSLADSQQVPSQMMTDLMALELGARPYHLVNGAGPDILERLPTARIHIPAWMQPRRPFVSHQLHSAALFSTNLSGGSYDRCDGRGYAPAWWLNPKVEARRAYHFDMVAAVACEYGVPTSLLDAVIAQESGYKNWAISHKGAMGMMQIMPGTARQLGLADPFNSLANMRAGARYLREQLDRFGRVDLALAAYNAGPHRRSLREGRLPMIAETLHYVRTIMTNWTRLSPRNVKIASVDRGAIAAAAVASSGFRSVNLVRYDGLSAARPF